MSARRPLAPVERTVPAKPESLAAQCEAVRENPFALNHWEGPLSPEVWLAGCVNNAGLFLRAPSSLQLTLQAAAQMLSAVRAGKRGEELAQQPAASAWLAQSAVTSGGSVPVLSDLRRLAAGEVSFEVRKELLQCERLLTEFAPELAEQGQALQELVQAISSKEGMAHASARPSTSMPTSFEPSDTQGTTWLRARMTAAYLRGDEALSAALRAALQALPEHE